MVRPDAGAAEEDHPESHPAPPVHAFDRAFRTVAVSEAGTSPAAFSQIPRFAAHIQLFSDPG